MGESTWSCAGANALCEMKAIKIKMVDDSKLFLKLTGDDVSLKDIGSPLALKALVMARSVLGEFASQNYNPSYEKY